MKKLLIIIGLFIGLTLAAQDIITLTHNTYGIQVKNDINTSQVRIKAAIILNDAELAALTTRQDTDSARIDVSHAMFADSLGWPDIVMGAGNTVDGVDVSNAHEGVFNVLDYGATDGGSNNDAVGIRAAIDSAHAQPYGGRVIVPAGQYNIEDSIVLRSKVHIEMDPWARLYVDQDNNSSIFYAGAEDLRFCTVHGGRLQAAGTNGYDWNGFQMDFTHGYNATENRFYDISIIAADTAFNIQTNNSGYYNGNFHSGIWFDDSKVQLNLSKGTTSSGASGNTFSNIQWQDGDSTYVALNLEGSSNVISPAMMWDYGIGGPATQKTIKFGEAAHSNTLVTGWVSSDEAAGYDVVGNWRSNLIITNGTIWGLPRVAHITLTHDSEAQDTILSTKGNYLIYDVKIAVSEAFDDSGTDYIDVGFHSNTNYFLNDGDVSATGFPELNTSNLPRQHSGPSGFILVAAYDGQNNDATTGIAEVWVYYTMIPEAIETVDGPGGSRSSFTDLTVTGTITGDATINFAADAQANDDYEIDIPTITALTTGLTVTFTATTANTDGATLEITSVGDLDAILKLHDQALVTGDIEAGQVVMCTFDGTSWQMVSQLAQ